MALHQAFTFVLSGPKPLIRTINVRPENILIRELGALFNEYQSLSVTEPMAIIAFHLAFSCGLRTSEMLRVKWEDFNYERSCLAIHECMSGRIRIVTVTEVMFAALDQIPEAQRFGPLFPSPNALRAYNRKLIRAGENIRIEPRPSFSALRRCAIWYLGCSGVSPMALARAGIIPRRSWLRDMVPWIHPPELSPRIHEILEQIFNTQVIKQDQ
jgi:integrase